MFVLLLNLFGMIPYAFAVTSHIIVTFMLALVVILTARRTPRPGTAPGPAPPRGCASPRSSAGR
jgi:hypothetical protein